MNPNYSNSFRSVLTSAGAISAFRRALSQNPDCRGSSIWSRLCAAAKADPAFARNDGYLKHMSAGRRPLYLAERLTEHLGGAKIYFKREEMTYHTG